MQQINTKLLVFYAKIKTFLLTVWENQLRPHIYCCGTIFPFNYLSSNKNFLASCTNTDSNITQWKDLDNDRNSSLSLKPSSNLELLLNQFNNTTPENSNNPENISSSKYYDIEKMISLY